jgi:hypothetical protein
MFKTKRSTSNFKKVFYKHEYNKKINKFISIFFIFKPLKMFNGCRPLKKNVKKVLDIIFQYKEKRHAL